MFRLLLVLIAMGGASFAWRAFAALYERHRAERGSPDPSTEKWWRIESRALAVLLLSFVLTVIASAARAPRWVALLLFGVLGASLVAALAGAATLRAGTARKPQ